jgi:5'-phosphate synthase pdxT subunit
MILLSKTADDRVVGKTNQPLLDMLDVKLERNSFGRQRESFEAEIVMDSISIPKFRGVFIRAPSISELNSDVEVEVLAKFNEKVVAVKKGNIIGTAFHPELTKDVSLHKYFVNLVRNNKN